jgi:hypothetical protein
MSLYYAMLDGRKNTMKRIGNKEKYRKSGLQTVQFRLC